MATEFNLAQSTEVKPTFNLDESVEVDSTLPEGDALDAIGEPLQALASGVAGSVVGGYKGLYEALDPFAAEGSGADVSAQTQEEFAQMGAPETQAGQRGLETMQDLIETGIDIARIPISGIGGLATLLTGLDPDEAAKTVEVIKSEGIGKVMGSKVFDATGSPIMGTMAELSPEVAESMLGLNILKGSRAIQKTGDVVDLVSTPRILNPDINPVSTARLEYKQKIADDIRAGGTDSRLATYIIDGSGKLKNDPVAVDAIKQGFDPSVISAIKGAPDIDKEKMLSMLNVMKKTKENARFGMDNRPSDVAGASLMDRIKYVKSVNNKAGKELDGIAKSLKGQYADFDAPMNNFIEGLESMGVSVNPKTLKPNYKESIIQGLPEPQKAINNIINRLATAKKRGVTPDAYDMHMLKKFIDENVSYGGKGAEGLKGKTQTVLKKLRREIDGSLDNAFPEYNRVNTEYADTRGAIDAIQDTAGRKMDLSGANAEKATGTLLRRLMSNYSNRVNLYDAIKQLEDVGVKYGSDFSDDLKTQILFADELDKQFGAVARASLAGEVGKGVKQAGETLLGQKTLTGTLLEAGAGVADKLRGINDDNAFKTMESLLKGD